MEDGQPHTGQELSETLDAPFTRVDVAFQFLKDRGVIENPLQANELRREQLLLRGRDGRVPCPCVREPSLTHSNPFRGRSR